MDVFSQAEGRFQRRCWDEVQVGDVVRVRKDEMLPADLLLLNSSTDEDESAGHSLKSKMASFKARHSAKLFSN